MNSCPLRVVSHHFKLQRAAKQVIRLQACVQNPQGRPVQARNFDVERRTRQEVPIPAPGLPVAGHQAAALRHGLRRHGEVTLQTTLRHDGAQPLQFSRWGHEKNKCKKPPVGDQVPPGRGRPARAPPSAPAGRTYRMDSDYQAQQSWQSNGTTFPAPASTDYQNAGGANQGAPLPFSHPYYAMDAERTIHLKVMGKGLDTSGLAVHQDEIINTVVNYVQDSLCKKLSYREIILSVNSTPEAPVKATTSSCRATSSRRSCSYSWP
ncbi:hypothetical protein PR003_g17821 [Phytophthora rubi]|uniref:Uncharacterized protein n=1 Tax=Phytophthora rubi TaxID=129364 RepID=A0A6A3K1K6_9STRA|nr:hypothetical protein PR002_g18702 [Phytophthora rubi]KAE9008124.1 hypothetical protein PR001_g16788 [Phytophthora rubi]KAE9320044.1 hypothetical protein PR003_g17821 [Phytophthora rubi]